MKTTLQNLKNNIIQAIVGLLENLQETSFFNSVLEKYNSLSNIGRKFTFFSITLFIFLILFYLPYSFISSANTIIDEFLQNERRAETLVESYSQPAQYSLTSSGFSFNSMQRQLKKKLNTLNFSSKQAVSIQHKPHKKVDWISIKINWLNLKEAVRVGKLLEQTHPQMKIIEMSMASETRPFYYTANYMLKFFKLEKN